MMCPWPLGRWSVGMAEQVRTVARSHGRLACVLALLIAASCTSLCVALITREHGNEPPEMRLLIIDTDPGVDDAGAIFTALGSPHARVMGVTAVRGNTNIANVVINALKILMVANRNDVVPVYNGSNFGLIGSPAYSDDWFGKDGLGDLSFPQLSSVPQCQPGHAASFLARIVKENPGQITIVALGPLTNLALALHLNPDLLKEAKNVVVLGGSIRGMGNTAPGIEFNFFMDPAAASVVLDQALSSGVTITLVPMETVIDDELTLDWRWKILANINNSVVSYLNLLEKKELKLHPMTIYTPFDSYAMAVALNKGAALTYKKLYGFVEVTGEKTKGALVIDYFNLTSKPANLDIVMEFDKSLMKTIVYDSLSNFDTH